MYMNPTLLITNYIRYLLLYIIITHFEDFLSIPMAGLYQPASICVCFISCQILCIINANRYEIHNRSIGLRILPTHLLIDN